MPTQETMVTQVKRLIKTSRNRKRTGEQICALGDEAIAALCTIAQTEGCRLSRWRWLCALLTVFGYSANLVVIATIPQALRAQYQYIAMGIAGLGIFGNLMTFTNERPATNILTKIQDVRAVGPLLDALGAYSRDFPIRQTIRKSLGQLLPLLKASDADNLLPRHVSAINREVELCRAWKWGSSHEVEYALVLFKALEQIGDETTLLAVRNTLPSVKNTRVVEAMDACIPFLQARAQMGKHILLRPVAESVNQLLRSANNAAETDHDRLLRPVQSEDG